MNRGPKTRPPIATPIHLSWQCLFPKLQTAAFKLAVPRALVSPGDVIHLPHFTDYDSSLAPHSLVFASALNFKADGTFPPAAEDSTTGLNPVPTGTFRPNQIFATQVPVTSSNTYTRLTKNPILPFVAGINPMSSNSRRRIVFNVRRSGTWRWQQRRFNRSFLSCSVRR